MMINQRKILSVILLLLTVFCSSANAALPFVTDDAFIQKPHQLALETFAERWREPAKVDADKKSNLLYSYFLSASYGLTKHFELTMAGNVGYDVRKENASFMNPIVQLKTKLFEAKNPAMPSLALDLGYVNKNGKGEYFDPATNFYAIAAATSRFFNDDLIVHINVGKKASYDITTNYFQRTHLGVGIDAKLYEKFRLVVESYNGAPNSPRDSLNYFHSYQVGVKWLKSDHVSFYTIYGAQPTFVGYAADNRMLYRNTSWVQVGARLVFDNVLR